MKRNDYVENYFDAYREMKEAAIEKMKNYGKTLDVYEVCKQLLMEREGYKSADEIPEDEFEDFKCTNIYSCYFEGKHEQIYCAQIVKVRYNTETLGIEVYLETDDGYISAWYPIYWISGEVDAVWMTIFDFAK